MAYDALSGALLGLLPVASIIGLGAILRRRTLPDPSIWSGIDRLNFFVLVPCLIVATLSDVDVAQLPVWTIAGIMPGALAVVIALLSLGYAFMPKATTAIASYSSIFQTLTRWNASVALVVVGELFDSAAITVTALMPVINIVNVAMMVWLLTDRAVSWATTGLKVTQNPIILMNRRAELPP